MAASHAKQVVRGAGGVKGGIHCKKRFPVFSRDVTYPGEVS
jgi:hypothetical protein